jgi:hypothetical protein
MKTTRISRERTLVNNVPNESRARKESEGVKQLVNLDQRTSVLQRNGGGRQPKDLPSYMLHMGG